MAKDIQQEKAKIRDIFKRFSEEDEKWKYLLKIAREHEGMDPSLKDPKFLVKGCAAKMYLVPEFLDGQLFFHMDTDGGVENPLFSRGLGVMAITVFGGATPQSILDDFTADAAFFQDIGLTVGLSATRANGFGSLLKQIFMYAQVYSRM